MDIKICTTLDEAVRLSASLSHTKILAGGTDVMPALNRKAKKENLVLVYIGGLNSLKTIREEEGEIRIGALVTDTMLCESDLIRFRACALWQAAFASASMQVRNRATVGGNIANASPAADVLCALEAFHAKAFIAGPAGSRLVPVCELVTGPGNTALEKGEIITEIAFRPCASSFHKIGKRKAMTISVANCAAAVELNGDIIQQIRVIIGSAAPTPVRADAVEQALTGKKVSKNLIDEAAGLAGASISPITDQRATAWYRRQVVPVLVARAVASACKEGGICI